MTSPPTAARPITALLLDCDNTLVLSEVHAFAACADVVNSLLADFNSTVRFTPAKLMSTFVGQNFRSMLAALQSPPYNLLPPLPPHEIDALVAREEDAVIARLRAAPVQQCPGAREALEAFVESRRVGQPLGGGEGDDDDVATNVKGDGSRRSPTLAVVSSSAMRRVLASLETAGLLHLFTQPDAELIFSAASCLPSPSSKPDPAIYLHAMRVLGVDARECVAVEDTASGALSAVRAGVKGVVGYLGPYVLEDEEKGRDDGRDGTNVGKVGGRAEEMERVLRAAGAHIVMHDWNEFPRVLAELQRIWVLETGSVVNDAR